PDDAEPVPIDGKDGFIIPESDDGDGGFLFVYNKPRFQRTGGLPLGFVSNGKVYINKDRARLDTPVHEFAHIWSSWARMEKPELYNKGVELIKQDKTLIEETRALYPDISEDGLYEEALATAIGRRGAEIFASKPKLAERFTNWLKALYRNIKQAIGFQGTTQEFINARARDLL